MRGFISKVLRREARTERSMERDMPARDLTQKRSGAIINHPYSIRATYLALKRAYLRLLRSSTEPKLAAIKPAPRQQTRFPRGDNNAVIQKPLMLILQHCQPEFVRNAAGIIVLDPVTQQPEVVPHPIYVAARRAADKGRGDLVQKMARQFLTA